VDAVFQLVGVHHVVGGRLDRRSRIGLYLDCTRFSLAPA
jgi:hypothetical protein